MVCVVCFQNGREVIERRIGVMNKRRGMCCSQKDDDKDITRTKEPRRRAFHSCANHKKLGLVHCCRLGSGTMSTKEENPKMDADERESNAGFRFVEEVYDVYSLDEG